MLAPAGKAAGRGSCGQKFADSRLGSQDRVKRQRGGLQAEAFAVKRDLCGQKSADTSPGW